MRHLLSVRMLYVLTHLNPLTNINEVGIFFTAQVRKWMHKETLFFKWNYILSSDYLNHIFHVGKCPRGHKKENIIVDKAILCCMGLCYAFPDV